MSAKMPKVGRRVTIVTDEMDRIDGRIVSTDARNATVTVDDRGDTHTVPLKAVVSR